MMITRNLLEVQEEIKRCEEDKSIKNENKKTSLRILKTYIEVLKSKVKYRELKRKYCSKCIELNRLTEHSILLTTDLEENLHILKEYIKNSSLVSLLDKNRIKNCSFENIKNATYPYRKGMEKEYETLSLAIDIHKLINDILENIMQKNSLIKQNLEKDINIGLLEKCSHKETNKEGKKRISIKAKTLPEYMACRDIVYSKLDEMLEEGAINQVIYDCGTILVNELFNYYIEGLDEIIITDDFKKETQFNKKKNIPNHTN